MFQTHNDAGTRSTRLCINPAASSQGWRLHFQRAGWRSFLRPGAIGSDLNVWYFKRNNLSFVIFQRDHASHYFDADLPVDAIKEINDLLVRSNLVTSSS